MLLVEGLRRGMGHITRAIAIESRRRNRLAARYLQGDGIEIGALNYPLPMPRRARVRYVDRMSLDDLRSHYPELAELPVVAPDIVDDGQRLTTLADESVDFIVANHFIEHTEDPLATLESHLRVLRPGGVLYMAVPDKRRTFDLEREVTPIEHIVRDHNEGPEVSRAAHYRDWARHVEHADDVEARARELMDQDYSIHFHVWTPEAFRELLDHARDAEGLPLRIEELVPNGNELVVILRKTASSSR